MAVSSFIMEVFWILFVASIAGILCVMLFVLTLKADPLSNG
jgi:hypothetical protein